MLHEAIRRLRPKAQFSVNGDKYKGVEWLDEEQTMPTEEEVSAKIVEIEAEKLANLYKDKRNKEYPDIGDQLDAIWKELGHRRLQGENLVSDCDLMLGKILAVKKKYPKGE